jgi:hypothetical protein
MEESGVHGLDMENDLKFLDDFFPDTGGDVDDGRNVPTVDTMNDVDVAQKLLGPGGDVDNGRSVPPVDTTGDVDVAQNLLRPNGDGRNAPPVGISWTLARALHESACKVAIRERVGKTEGWDPRLQQFEQRLPVLRWLEKGENSPGDIANRVNMEVLIKRSIQMGDDCNISCENERDEVLRWLQSSVAEKMDATIKAKIKCVWNDAGMKATIAKLGLVWKKDPMKVTWDQRMQRPRGLLSRDDAKNVRDRFYKLEPPHVDKILEESTAVLDVECPDFDDILKALKLKNPINKKSDIAEMKDAMTKDLVSIVIIEGLIAIRRHEFPKKDRRLFLRHILVLGKFVQSKMHGGRTGEKNLTFAQKKRPNDLPRHKAQNL